MKGVEGKGKRKGASKQVFLHRTHRNGMQKRGFGCRKRLYDDKLNVNGACGRQVMTAIRSERCLGTRGDKNDESKDELRRKRHERGGRDGGSGTLGTN